MARDMIRGFVLVTCKPKVETEPTLEKAKVCSTAVGLIKKIDGVQDAFPTSKSDADIVVFVEAKSNEEINTIIENIRNTLGISKVLPRIEIIAE
ncbi:MAG: hypothetical protein HMLIMOIP_001794 [Candidatus Nitrosomirales archaeon]|jgi:hypothetical protein